MDTKGNWNTINRKVKITFEHSNIGRLFSQNPKFSGQ